MSASIDTSPDLDRLAAEAEQLDAAEAPAPGAPEEQPAPAPSVPSAEILRELLPEVAGFFTPKLTAEECELLATKAGAVIDKWFPDGGLLGFLNGWREEIGLALALKAIFAPRIQAARESAPAAPGPEASTKDAPVVITTPGNA